MEGSRVTWTEIFTISALILNASALVGVVYQTWLTRKSLRAAKRSIDLSIKTMQVEMLPNANGVIQVQVKLEQWKNDLETLIKDSKVAAKNRDGSRMEDLACAGLNTPDGLVRRFGAEHPPNWLYTIWVAGAQYYYDAKAPQTGLWNKHENVPRYYFVPDLVKRCQDSIKGLQGLLDIIDDVVPGVYLNCPASVNDESFFD